MPGTSPSDNRRIPEDDTDDQCSSASTLSDAVRLRSAAEVWEAAREYTPPSSSRRPRSSGKRLYPRVVDPEPHSALRVAEDEKKELTVTEDGEPSLGSSRDVGTVSWEALGTTVDGEPLAEAAAAGYAVAAARSASNGTDYDNEILTMKRMAASGEFHDSFRDAPPPRVHESLEEYYRRHEEYYSSRATQYFQSIGADLSRVSMAELEQEGLNFARQHFDQCLPMEQGGQVVSVLTDGDDHTSQSPLSAVMAQAVPSTVSLTPDVDGSLHQAASAEAIQVSASEPLNDNVLVHAETTALPSGTRSVVPLPAQEGAATEATLIDSEPMDPGEPSEEAVPPWKYFDAEEAQVLDSMASTITDAPMASPTIEAEPTEETARYYEGTVLGHQEAEVVAIQDDQFAHPLELQNDATAELVGEDYSVGIAVIQQTPQQIVADLPSATGRQSISPAHVAVLQDNSTRHTSPTEVHATLVPRDVSSSVLYTSPRQDPVVTAHAVGSFVDNGRSMLRETSHVPAAQPYREPGLGRVPSQSGRTQSELYNEIRRANRSSPDLRSAWLAIPQQSETVAPAEKTVESEMSEDSVPDWLHLENARARFASPPPPQRFGSARGAVSSDSSPPSVQDRTGNRIGSSIARGTSNVIESLFGESKPPLPALLRRGNSASTPEDRAAQSIRPRTLLPWSVIFSPSSRMWVATLQTNQKALDGNNVAEASRSLRAFSLPTEKQAICLAKSWTPPRMLPFSEAKECHIGQTKFALLRRPCHCKNCGVVVCRDCTVQWPSKMLPDTYNRKDAGSLNVCKSCDWLSNAFRLALLEGNFDQAVALFETGNVNINSPFGNVKGELFFPVHCAVIGGNIQLLRWLVDEHCSPIKSLRVSGKAGQSAGKYTPIVTSKGRSLLGIAMEQGNIPIIRYLVVEKGLTIGSEKDITAEMLVANLQTVLHLIPADVHLDSHNDPGDVRHNSSAAGQEEADENSVSAEDGRSLSQEAQNYGAVKSSKYPGEENTGLLQDECVICYDNRIDCVANPCGHQIMCMRCAANVTRCPVCASDCTFLKVYK